MHIAAMYTITEWKEAKDQTETIENIEKYYESLKDFVWDPEKMKKESQEMQELTEADPFLAAGKRSVRRVTEARLPGQDEIENSML